MSKVNLDIQCPVCGREGVAALGVKEQIADLTRQRDEAVELLAKLTGIILDDRLRIEDSAAYSARLTAVVMKSQQFLYEYKTEAPEATPNDPQATPAEKAKP